MRPISADDICLVSQIFQKWHQIRAFKIMIPVKDLE